MTPIRFFLTSFLLFCVAVLVHGRGLGITICFKILGFGFGFAIMHFLLLLTSDSKFLHPVLFEVCCDFHSKLFKTKLLYTNGLFHPQGKKHTKRHKGSRNKEGEYYELI